MVCKTCGGPMPDGAPKQRRYCSEDCKTEARSKVKLEWYNRNKEKPEYKARSKKALEKYREANVDKLREKSRKFYQENYKDNPDYRSKAKEYKDEYYSDPQNVEKKRETDRAYYRKYRNKVKASTARYKKENRARVSKWCSSRKKAFNLATPNWLTKEQYEEMERVYWLAKDLKAISGEDYHVDHIVPLQGKDVCGLHVPWNLQVLPADLNLGKGNDHAIDNFPAIVELYNPAKFARVKVETNRGES